jgi:8-oxo-dGTP pyrophosphatase MutT (NUDIX family)
MQHRYNLRTYAQDLADLGIRPWAHQADRPDVLDLAAYANSGLTEEQTAELRFAPRTEAVFLVTPDGKPYTGFRTIGKPWTTVFALVGELVVLVAEYKHGADAISLVPPSGIPRSGETMDECAAREYLEETGFTVEGLEALAPNGLAVASRNSSIRYYPYIARIPEDSDRQPARLDDTEHIRAVLMPLGDWLELLAAGEVLDDCAYSATFLGLTRLGWPAEATLTLQ